MNNKSIAGVAMNIKRCALIFFYLVFLMQTYGFSAERYSYIERTGKETTKGLWQMEKKGGFAILTSTKLTKKHVYICSLDGDTKEWILDKPDSKTNATMKRENKYIIINGMIKGNFINKKVKIDSSPWYQNIMFSLPVFIKSNKKSMEFWSLRPEDLVVYKLKAEKVKIESINFNGNKIEAQKVKVSATGIFSIFWHGDYWFRKSDGKFIHYEGVNGIPGTSKTFIELIPED